MAQGARFFPFGLYGLNWSRPFADRMKALDNIAAAGFNTILAEDVSTDNFGTFLDEAARLQVRVLVGSASLPELSYIGATVDKYKSKPAVLGWSLFDDSDDGRLTFDSLRERNRYVKAKDSEHFTFSTLTGYYRDRRNAKAQWIDGSDASGYQSYPIEPPADYPFDYSSPLAQSFYLSRDYSQAAQQAKKAMFISSQAFQWSEFGRPNARLPTKAELRNMVFGHLLGGAKGIVAFSYSEELFNNKELWNELVAIKDDVLGPLKRPLLDGVITRKSTADVDLVYSYWQYRGGCYVGILNTSYDQAKQVDITLPAECAGANSAPIARLPKTLSISGNVITGSLLPTDVQFYRLDAR